ncbi:MAG: Wzz/FepE/Etk N-terminal domain-containing protein, partial [Blastocatellia bacterium]
LTEFLSILWRRKKLLLLMALVMLIATLIVIRRIPNLYESSALVVVNLRNDTEGLSEMNRFSTLQQGLTSRETLAALVRNHSLYPKAQGIDEAVEALQKSLKVETRVRGYYPEVPEAVLISHRYAEPKSAQAVVADLVKLLEHGNERIKAEAAAEAGRLASLIAEVENRLKALAPKRDLDMVRLESLSRSRVDSADSSRRQTIESSIESLSDNEYALQHQISEQRNHLVEHEKVVRSLPAAPGGIAYGALLIEKSKLEAEIQNYSGQYTDKHPKMVQLRNQVVEINRQINRLETQTGPALPAPLTPESRELGTMRRDLRRMETDLEVVQRQLQRKNQQIGKLPPVPDPVVDPVAGSSANPAGTESPASMAVRDDVARTEYDRMVMRYNWLLEKQDSMLKLSGARGPSQMMFHVIDNPSLPRLPAAPNRFTLQLMALGVAILFGLFIAFVIEIPRMFTINDNRDIEYFLGAPVLAAIPETLTLVERARSRKLRLTRGALVLTLAAALAPILVLLLTYLKIFQVIGGK